MTARTTRTTAHRLGPAEGTAMYVGAVLGPGVMSLPALGAAAAGPASVLAWLGLLVLSVPVALCFAALGGRHPDGGGVSVFVGRAFGRTAAAVVGWWFYAVVPVGVVAGALVGGAYAAAALGLGPDGRYAAAAALLGAAFAANYGGLRLSGRLQLGLVGALVVVLLVAIATAAPHARRAGFHPFFPHGGPAVGSAAVIVFYAFTGWEAAVHLSAEFRDPARDLPRVTRLALAVIAVLYLTLVLVTVGVLGGRAGATLTPMTDLLRTGLGGAAAPVTAVAAVLLSLGAVNTFIAGAARLGAALARDGALPRALARGGAPGQVPRISLTVQAAATGAVVAAGAAAHVELRVLMSLTSVLLGCVTVAGLAAAVRLLPDRRVLRTAALGAIAANLAVLAFGGRLLAVPPAVAVAAVAGAGAVKRRPAASARRPADAECDAAIPAAP